MENEVYQNCWNHKCGLCGNSIDAGGKMVSLCASMEKVTEDGFSEEDGAYSVTALCLVCATMVLGESVLGDLDPKLGKLLRDKIETLPEPDQDGTDDIEALLETGQYGADDIEETDADLSPDITLIPTHEGFYLKLDCGDGISQATSRLFTWWQVIQILITSEPDMFGVLSEPLHQVFPQALAEIGYSVPNRRGSCNKKNELKGGADMSRINIADQYWHIGLQAVEKKDWEKAITAFTRHLEYYPNDAAAYYSRGIAYGESYYYDEALEDFSRAISIDKSFAGAYNNRGLCYYKKSMFDEAIADYDKAIEIDPSDAVFYANRALAYRWKGDLKAALWDCNKAIKLEPDLTETHSIRGELYAEMGRYEKAIADFDRELAINPNDANACASRILAVAMLGDNG